MNGASRGPGDNDANFVEYLKRRGSQRVIIVTYCSVAHTLRLFITPMSLLQYHSRVRVSCVHYRVHTKHKSAEKNVTS